MEKQEYIKDFLKNNLSKQVKLALHYQAKYHRWHLYKELYDIMSDLYDIQQKCNVSDECINNMFQATIKQSGYKKMICDIIRRGEKKSHKKVS